MSLATWKSKSSVDESRLVRGWRFRSYEPEYAAKKCSWVFLFSFMNQSLGTLFVSEIVMAEVWGKYPAGHDHELVVLAARPNKSHQEMQEMQEMFVVWSRNSVTN